MGEAWITKHVPKDAAGVVGRDSELNKLQRFIADKRPVLLSGPPGSGKTSMAYALAGNREIVEVNASDARNKASILATVGEALKQQSLFFTGKLILVDEIDGLSGRSDRGAIPTLVKLLQKAAHPVILTSLDAYTDKLKPLRKACTVIDLAPLPNDIIVERLKAIAKAEKIQIKEDAIKAVARRSGGDMRAAINDLQTVALFDGDISVLGERETTETIANALTRVLKTTKAEVALPAFDNVDENIDKIFLWLDENLPREYTKPADTARVYDALAEADKFFGRIRRWQYYRFYVYVYALLSAGVALAKDEKYKGMLDYKRSERPLKIWIANNANRKKKSIAAKIAEGTHASTRRVMQEMPIHMAACKNRSYLTMLQDRFELDDEEAEWLQKKAA